MRIGRISRSCLQRPQSNTTVSTSRAFLNSCFPPTRTPMHCTPQNTAPETDAVEVMPLLRAVIHECHRFLLFYPDPSELIMQPSRPPSPEPKSARRPSNSRQCSQNGKDATTRPEDPAASPSETGSQRLARPPTLLPLVPTPPLFTIPVRLQNSQPRSMLSWGSPSFCLEI